MILVSKDPLDLKDRRVLQDPWDPLGSQETQGLLGQQDLRVTKGLQEMLEHQDQQVSYVHRRFFNLRTLHTLMFMLGVV